MSRIKELRKNLEKSLKELETARNKKILNYEMTQPGSPTLKTILISGSPLLTDTFLLYAIKDEDIDEEYRKAIARFEFDQKNIITKLYI